MTTRRALHAAAPYAAALLILGILNVGIPALAAAVAGMLS